MKDIDIKRIVDQTVNEMLRGSSNNLLNEDDTVYATRAKKDLVKAFQNYYNRHKKNASDWAKNIGINFDKSKERNDYERDMLKKYGSYEEILRQMSPEVRDAITAMNKLKDPATPKAERDAINKKYGNFAGLQRYRDILDKLSLTPAYDQERAKESGINKAPFGTQYKAVDKDGNEYLTGEKPKVIPAKAAKVNKNGKVTSPETPEIPADKITGYDYENLDLTAVPEKEILDYFKSGTRQKHHLDEDPNNPTYRELSEMANNGDKGALDVLKNLYFKAEFNKVMNSKFGYDFNMPGAMYTYGNSKLPKDTLVINFTTAHRCPAWKDCLVGYACYARGSEHNYEGLHKKNSNLHLMWQSTMYDPELMNAMQKVIKMYLVNPEEMAKALLSNETTRPKWIGFLTNGNTTFNQIDKKTNRNMAMPKDAVLGMRYEEPEDFTDMDESKSLLGTILENMETEAAKQKNPKGANKNLAGYIYESNWSEIFSEDDIAAINSNQKSLRAKFIRLNEEGDFIGQWLLDAFDKFAGELKLLGISTAAYTCRNLDFTKIQNIILNASTIKVGTWKEKDGNVSGAIARRFFAVSNELYDSLEDTYVPNGNKEFSYTPGNSKSDKKIANGFNENRAIIPLHREGDSWKVKYAPKPYTLNGDTTPTQFNDRFDPNGPTKKSRLYYKCPCGRYGDVLEKGKPIKMDCYLCRMCYEPKNQQIGELYVLVAVHGDNTDSFDMDKANAARGINNTMSTYKEAREIFGNRLSETTQMSEKEGIRLVGENGVNSAKAHISAIADSEAMAMRNENKNFSDLVNRMNIIENKRKKKIID